MGCAPIETTELRRRVEAPEWYHTLARGSAAARTLVL
jgi:hypothetical protein